MGDNIYKISILFLMIAFFSCHHEKEVVKEEKKTNAGPVSKAVPDQAAMGPGTFGSEAEVLSVNSIQDASSDEKFYKANILIHAITGRGSSLIQIVNAGDTINCGWPTYNAGDKQLLNNIANKKIMSAIISEFQAPASAGNISFTIQSYSFK